MIAHADHRHAELDLPWHFHLFVRCALAIL